MRTRTWLRERPCDGSGSRRLPRLMGRLVGMGLVGGLGTAGLAVAALGTAPAASASNITTPPSVSASAMTVVQGT